MRQGSAYALGGKRYLAQPHARGVEDGVGNCWSGGDAGRLASAQRRQFWTVDEDDINRRDFGERQNWIGQPVDTLDAGVVETHFLFERAAERLEGIAFHLVAHPIWI